ncbi:MAG: hypothetical protein U0768_02835 [Anaerolineae bacterium]
MRIHRAILLLILVLAFAFWGVAAAQGPSPARARSPRDAMGPAFTYQGRLARNGIPIGGNAPVACDMQFGLWDSLSEGGQLGITDIENGVTVANGVFTAQLNSSGLFGEYAFDGEERWLEVQVKCPGDADFVTLVPRQPITAAPFALSASQALGLRLPFAADVNLSAAPVSITNAGDGPAVYGEHNSSAGTTAGIVGLTASRTDDAAAVAGYATSSTGRTVGVYGESVSTQVVAGDKVGGGGDPVAYGVVGRTRASGGAGVYGTNDATTSTPTGVLGTVRAAGGRGVVGESDALSGFSVGVFGTSLSPGGAGGYFENTNGGIGAHIYGQGSARDAAALRVRNVQQAAGMAAYLTNSSNFATAHFANGGSGEVLYLQNGSGDFIRAVNQPETDIKFRVTTSGDVRADGAFASPAADFAEMLGGKAGLEPGDVLVVGEDGELTQSTEPYQTSVVGVYSTAPGFVGGQAMGDSAKGKVPLAVVGVAPVKVTDENGAVRPGDLLTTSKTPGHAMKAKPDAPNGTIVGKALEAHTNGMGRIRMLVVLH